MFEDSLFVSNPQTHHDRGWTALASFSIQAFFVGSAIILPVLFSDVLPARMLREILTVPAAPVRPAPASPNEQHHQNGQTASDSPQALRVPRIPRTMAREIDTENNPPAIGINVGDARAIGVENADPLSTLLISATPILPKPPAMRLKVSNGVERGLLMYEVKPDYPVLARLAKVQGEVILQAVIGKDGRIKNLHAVSGSPMLTKAAVDAVQQWRYRPYLLNGEPVEVETQITVSFKMS